MDSQTCASMYACLFVYHMLLHCIKKLVLCLISKHKSNHANYYFDASYVLRGIGISMIKDWNFFTPNNNLRTKRIKSALKS